MVQKPWIYLSATILGMGLTVAPKPATAATGDDARTRCEALVADDLADLVDAPTKILSVQYSVDGAELFLDLARAVGQVETKEHVEAVVAEARKNLAGIQPLCHVSGYVVPNVAFELLLPAAHWNGRFLHVGCGGMCGTIVLHAQDVIACARHGEYACIATDTGHTSSNDGLWLRNNLQGQIDFDHRATHVTALAGKAITERYYKEKPKFSYFDGCSTGGYQALVEAQRYPRDFNGIIAGAPDMDEADLAIRSVWIKKHFLDAQGKPRLSSADIDLLHKAVLARCDLDDGVKDGIISDPVHCDFDPSEIQCNARKTSRCLDASQVEAVRNIYGSPKNSRGDVISTRGVLPGSELNWSRYYAQDTWAEIYFRQMWPLSKPGTQWRYEEFDFDLDEPRSGVGVLFADTNPDLRKFKAYGGKLISYQGTNDEEEIPGAIFDYYETVEKTMGGRAATQQFFRLFAMPGMNHCSTGVGADAADFLEALESWVERGEAPSQILSGHFKNVSPAEAYAFGKPYPYRMLPPNMTNELSFSRPLYPYPQYPKYKGSGDPNRAENFAPALPRE